MVRTETRCAITLCYPCVPISSLGPENVKICGVECRVIEVFASDTCLDRLAEIQA